MWGSKYTYQLIVKPQSSEYLENMLRILSEHMIRAQYILITIMISIIIIIKQAGCSGNIKEWEAGAREAGVPHFAW